MKAQIVSFDYLLSLLVATYVIGYAVTLSGDVTYRTGLAERDYQLSIYADTLMHNLYNFDLAVDYPGELNSSALSGISYNILPYRYCITLRNSSSAVSKGDCSFDFARNIVNRTRYGVDYSSRERVKLEVAVHD